MTDAQNTNTKDWAAVAAKSQQPAAADTDESTETTTKHATPPTPELTQLSLAECEAQLAAAEKKAEEYMNKYMQSLAEQENVRRRAERDIANAHKFSIEKFALELLPIIDNLERALEFKMDNDATENLYHGVELTLKVSLEALQKFGVVQLNSLGAPFNPEQHTAISVREDTSVAPHTVLQVLQKGYMLKERLLRPAMVIVSK